MKTTHPIINIPLVTSVGRRIHRKLLSFALFGCLASFARAEPDLKGINVSLAKLESGAIEITLDEKAMTRNGETRGDRILERSEDLVKWIEIARLPASFVERKYVDEHPPVRAGFYRLRVVEEPDYAAGQVWVQFRADADEEEIRALSLTAGLTVPEEIMETRMMTDSGATPMTRFATSMDPFNATSVLLASPLVMKATPDMEISLNSVANDPSVVNGELWAMSNDPGGINAIGAWAGGKTGSNSVVVAVIDTGVGPHPDLAANMFANPMEIAGNNIDDDGNGYVDDVCGWDFVNGSPDASDDSGHGTHVAGTIGAVGNNGIGVAGVCWNVRILPLKVLGANGRGNFSYMIRAIDYVADMKRRGINIVALNMSLGSLPMHQQDFAAISPPIKDALARAAAAGVIAVCAAGNDGNNNDIYPVIPTNIDPTSAGSGLRSVWDNVVSIASVNRSAAKPGYSNFGRLTVDLGAPGGDRSSPIFSTIPGGYGGLYGTSMAAPHVTGALALYASNWTADGHGMRQALLASAVPTPSLSGNAATGGRLNLPRFLNQAPNQSNRAPLTRDDLVPLAVRRAIEINPLANDSDPDGNPISIAEFSQATAGTVVRKAENPSTLIYTPGGSFKKTDRFSYTAIDSAGATSLGSVSIHDPAVVNMPPVVSDDEVTIELGQSLSLKALLWNDRDPNGDRIRLHSSGAESGWAPIHGTIIDGEYTPKTGFVGHDEFAYSITDGSTVATGSVKVNVIAPGGAPSGRVKPIQPENLAEKVRRTPLFRWKAASGAVTYDLEISIGKPGRSPRGYTRIASREFRIPASDALPANTKCFWRVRPVGGNGAPGLWSTYRSFSSRAAAPPDKRARLVWPAAAGSMIPISPRLLWDSVEDADGYQLQIARGLPETGNIQPGFSLQTVGPEWQVPSNMSLDNGQVYFWRVMPWNEEGEGYWSEWQAFTCGASTPSGKPVLRSPAAGASNISTTPSFDWDDQPGATSWHLQIRRKSNGALIVDTAGISGSQYNLTAKLAEGENYDWRICAANASGTGIWSDRWTFRTLVTSPVSLLTPANGATDISPNATISWSSAAGADGYDYEVYDGSNMIAGYGITYSNGPYRGTSVKLDLAYGKTYKWRARARILPQDNPWTSMWSFKTKDGPAFNLVSPANGSSGLQRSVTLSWSSHPDADGYDFEVMHGGSQVAGYGITYSGGPYRATSVSLTLDYGKTYTWRARPRILPQDNPWSSSWSFTIKGDPGFSLVSPVDGATNLPASVRLDWSSHPDADGYDFEVYQGGNKVAGMGVTYSGGPYRGTSVTVTLSQGKTYSWRARARVLPQDNPWSAHRSFSTEAPPPVLPGTPVLVSPAHHASGLARPVTFGWQAAPNAVKYRLEVWYQPSSGEARQRVLNKTLTGTNYKAGSPDPDPLGPGRNYYWKVLGINSSGQESPWSAERHFSTRTTP